MIAAIGTFDGFHAGHRVLLEETGRLAHRNKTNWGVVTFSPHPDVYFGNVSKLLFSEYEKNAAAKFLKVPEVIKLPFGEICGMGPEDFLAMLAKEYSISGIAVGVDFKFGAGARGDAALIKEFCADNALPCSVIETVNYPEGPEAGKKISARVLREWLKSGNADMLRGALKFPCPLSGIVVRGDGRGTKLGFPTVNISEDAEKMLPADGVYAVSVLAGGVWRAGAMFAGLPPTFKDAGEARVEVHISEFSGDLYG
ncbi:MAG: hypothetical protein FWG09_03850, partial [Synergistaceae bacterium]|nr:hypothetical protein [Synergistaceae bacterium]